MSTRFKFYKNRLVALYFTFPDDEIPEKGDRSIKISNLKKSGKYFKVEFEDRIVFKDTSLDMKWEIVFQTDYNQRELEEIIKSDDFEITREICDYILPYASELIATLTSKIFFRPIILPPFLPKVKENNDN